MYAVDDADEVLELGDVPRSNVGAPCPVMLATGLSVSVAYWLAGPRRLDLSTGVELVGLVRFELASCVRFGPPNDEAFAGHPLASRGLEPYRAFEVARSSWIRALERMNAVHPSHDRARFLQSRRHYIWTFHDQVLECVAKRFDTSTVPGPPSTAISRIASE